MPKINLAIEADSATEMKEILSQLATGSVVEVTQSLNTANKKATEEVEKAAKKEPAKKKKATAKKKEEVSTASTSNTEPSKTGEKVAPTETDSETEEVSATADLHPGATKADVQAAMKKAMANGNRDRIKMCFGRYNAEKLSDLKEEHYGKFITDLETLVGE
ncbi:hypothetical protein OP565_003274 [Enterococcus faecalis]|uniref:hypothetical protein n=1 Tax=Enterococcus TaxID=1350 RepID=UPI001C11F272|nr:MULTISPECIES: hypothetical protein [unclassified Enterococcus]EKC6645560.1 hypothetical protein [Enterococcus faecalis]MBU5553515.1 hypothetical protein [Enterococcus sp. S157_ASV_20]EKC6734774.1 hypothetical protein [Enterococcus faecalis]EKZ0053976.1 hypothetical protein [Enterococcus faecalis]MBU5495805.1 hypothetical protein [Enterococcus sp. S171_ASV_20]